MPGMLTRLASVAKRRVFPLPEVSAWNNACRLAAQVPRRTAGTIDLMGYHLRYPDLLTLCPQWDDIFVRRSLAFAASADAPRILDCGANVGLASLFFKRLFPDARVTAYEADPALHAMLVENLASNGASDVEARQAAVWTLNGSVMFRSEGADSGAIDALAAATVTGTPVTVPSVRLANLLDEGIDLLKLDIEGAEAAVLDDARGRLANVSAMLVDVHEFDPDRRTLPRILDIIAEAGFEYTIANLTPLPWRNPVAATGSPFPGQALCWTLLVRAWRRPR